MWTESLKVTQRQKEAHINETRHAQKHFFDFDIASNLSESDAFSH